jgi:orotidine-5'-phosphate decarboxylase
MNRKALINQIRKKKSFLCVGLDTDISKIPKFLLKEKNPVLKFNKEIIEATKDLVVAYKPNLAFYEAMGPSGWKVLEKTKKAIPDNIFTIADAKRGDIGNTSRMYAKAFFEILDFDSVTVAPYMGIDSVSPFLEFDNKWVILLGLTSNKGSSDFQMKEIDSRPLYAEVISKAQEWGNPNNLMFVIGATHPEKFRQVRKLAEDYFFLVPGVGAQGGTVDDVVTYGKNKDIGLLINSSRGILYASNGKDFAEAARSAAQKLVDEMNLSSF